MHSNSDSETFEFKKPTAELEFTGERFTTIMDGEIKWQHLHRYLFCIDLCRGKKVLDIASGEGYGSSFLGQYAASVVGVDIDENSIAHANKFYGNDKVSFVVGTATNIPLEDKSVDAVVSFETIEHLTEHDAFLLEIKRVLKPNGILIISSPDIDTYNHDGVTTNLFHSKELNKEDFTNLIKKYFSDCKFFGQKPICGSIIMHFEMKNKNAAPIFFDQVSENRYKKSAEILNPIYLLAIASDFELPGGRVSPTFLNDQLNYCNQLTQEVGLLERRLREEEPRLKEELTVKVNELTDLKNHLNSIYTSKGWRFLIFYRKCKQLCRKLIFGVTNINQ